MGTVVRVKETLAKLALVVEKRDGTDPPVPAGLVTVTTAVTVTVWFVVTVMVCAGTELPALMNWVEVEVETGTVRFWQESRELEP